MNVAPQALEIVSWGKKHRMIDTLYLMPPTSWKRSVVKIFTNV